MNLKCGLYFHSRYLINWIIKKSKSQNINLKLAKLHETLFIESSPGPVKFAASLIGLCNSVTRLPLVDIQESTKVKIKECLEELELI